jgi:NTP pyrophosphatase (non-canonical NTP hydrolase)
MEVRAMEIREFQDLIARRYKATDQARGVPKTFLWFMEEVGELATALASQEDRTNMEEEFADVLAWLCTLANITDVDLEKACAKYTSDRVRGFKPK